MGLKFLDGRSWADVTRDERFFCQRLFSLAEGKGLHRFVRAIAKHASIPLDEAANWELGFEVCFYRDLWQHRGRPGALYSRKRTFDLCLFSDACVVVIEAKAQQAFDADQVDVFVRDRDQVAAHIQVADVKVVGLCSSRCPVPSAIAASFDGRVVTWAQMAQEYESDAILLRADAVFGSPPLGPTPRMSGLDIVTAVQAGRHFFVGRGRGLEGPAFAEDVRTGRWRTHGYQTTDDPVRAAGTNWFSSADFLARVNAPPAEPQS